MKEFGVSDGTLYLFAGLVIAFVLAQSVFFFIKAWRRAKEKGMDMKSMRKVVLSSAIFSILPAISIFIGVITLSKFLGIALPWLRLSVIGSLTYELTAAGTAAKAAAASISETITDPQLYVMLAWVMTIGSIFPMLLVPLFSKRIQKGVNSLQAKDNKWGELFVTSLFLGMISAFLGVVFADVTKGLEGWIPVFVLLASAAIMAVCGLLVKKLNVKWLQDFALPFSMIGAMGFAVFITDVIK